MSLSRRGDAAWCRGLAARSSGAAPAHRSATGPAGVEIHLVHLARAPDRRAGDEDVSQTITINIRAEGDRAKMTVVAHVRPSHEGGARPSRGEDREVRSADDHVGDAVAVGVGAQRHPRAEAVPDRVALPATDLRAGRAGEEVCRVAPWLAHERVAATISVDVWPERHLLPM